jgi:peptidoglycan/LPS O-acetylase OafA/YrhL
MAESPNRDRAARLLAGGAIGGTLVWLACLAGSWLAVGAEALAGCILGGATVLVFFALGQLVQVLTAEARTVTVMAASLASYVVRAAGLAVVLVFAGPLAEGPGRVALVPTMIAVVLGWVAAEVWTFTRLRIPVFDPPRATDR